MKIKYQNQMDDLLSYARYFIENSPAVQRSIARQRWILPACVFIASSFAGYIFSREMSTLLFGAIGGIIFGVLYLTVFQLTYKRSMLKMMRRTYEESSKKGVLGTHELEISEDSLIERTEYSEDRTRLTAVEGVASTEHHIILLSGTKAHVIPKRSIIEGNYEAFIEELKNRVPKSA